MIDNKLKKYVLKRAKEEGKNLPSNYLRYWKNLKERKSSMK